jgi:hypothetical protein
LIESRLDDVSLELFSKMARQALSRRLTLVTGKCAEFGRVNGLRLGDRGSVRRQVKEPTLTIRR